MYDVHNSSAELVKKNQKQQNNNHILDSTTGTMNGTTIIEGQEKVD